MDCRNNCKSRRGKVIDEESCLGNMLVTPGILNHFPFYTAYVHVEHQTEALGAQKCLQKKKSCTENWGLEGAISLISEGLANPSQAFSSRRCLLKCRRFICYIGKPGPADACVCLPKLEIRSWPPGKIPSQMAGWANTRTSQTGRNALWSALDDGNDTHYKDHIDWCFQDPSRWNQEA